MEDVKLIRRGEQVEGTLHLTPHHLIFSHIPLSTTPDPPNGTTVSSPRRPRELWITYPIIHTCTLRPSPHQSHLPSSIRLRCRDFTFVCFCFVDEKKARDVYESIKAWTCKLGKIEKLYAFSYEPPKPEKEVNGWNIYDPLKEWQRQGITDEDTDKGWRISRINTDYEVGRADGYRVRSCSNALVLAHVPCPSSSSRDHIRQYPQIRRSIPFTSPITCVSISSSRQQLLDHSKFTALGRGARESKYPR